MNAQRALAVALGVLVASSGLYYFLLPLADNDLWGHVYFGRMMISSWTLPATNLLSYTAPDHPWINHEILAECLFAVAFLCGGGTALLGLKIALGLVTLAIMARTGGRLTGNAIALAIALVCGAALMFHGYLVRPQILTFLGLAITWNRLHAYAANRRPRDLWLLPFLTAIWINTHGGVMAGAGLMWIFLAHEAWATTRPGERNALLATAAAIGLALCVNPYGIRLPWFLLGDLLQNREISEWQPVSVFDTYLWLFKAVVVLVGAATIAAPARRNWESLSLALVAVATFRHVRHLPLFAIMVTPALAEALSRLATGIARRLSIPELSSHALALIAVSVLGLAGYQLSWVVGVARAWGVSILVPTGEYPVAAVRFMRANRLKGNLAVEFDWGEYAIWHLSPDCPVSIDGRYTTAYPGDVIEQSWRFMAGSADGDRILSDASLVLVRSSGRAAHRLVASKAWASIYTDPTAQLFVRSQALSSIRFASPAPDSGISRFP